MPSSGFTAEFSQRTRGSLPSATRTFPKSPFMLVEWIATLCDGAEHPLHETRMLSVGSMLSRLWALDQLITSVYEQVFVTLALVHSNDHLGVLTLATRPHPSSSSNDAKQRPCLRRGMLVSAAAYGPNTYQMHSRRSALVSSVIAHVTFVNSRQS